MTSYLTLDQYQLHCPTNNTDWNTVQFEPMVNDAALAVFADLPKTMVAVFKTGDFTGKPELQAYWEGPLRMWLAKQVWYTMIELSGLNVSPEGGRQYTSPQSTEVADNTKARIQNVVRQSVSNARAAALHEYNDAHYVFDGVAYPPTVNMSGIWNDGMAGLNYLNGAYGWGWYNGGSYIGLQPSFGTSNNQQWGVHLVGNALI